MDKLTVIKIKYNDGTYSDEIPISALAKNVEWNDSYSLVDILGEVAYDTKGSIQDQISQLFNEKINISTMQDYINNTMPSYITNWLNTNVNPVGSAVIVDESLTISGAAADARVTGNRLTDLKSDLQSAKDSLVQDVYNLLDYPTSELSTNGITFSPYGNYIVINGSASAEARLRIYNKNTFPFGVESGTKYYIAMNQDEETEHGLYFKVYYYDNNGSTLIVNINNGYFALPDNAIGFALTLVVPNGSVLNNLIVRPVMYKLTNVSKILENVTQNIKSNLYTNLREMQATSNGISFIASHNSIILNGTSGENNPIFSICDSHYSLLYNLKAGDTYWFDLGLDDLSKTNYIYIRLAFYLSDETVTNTIFIYGVSKITIPENAIGMYMLLTTQKAGLVVCDNTIVTPGIYRTNPMQEDRILKQAIDANQNIISVNGNYASYKDFNLYGIFINRKTGVLESDSIWRSGFIRIPFSGKYQIFQTYSQFGNTQLYVPLYDEYKRFIKSIKGIIVTDNIIEITISNDDLYKDMACFVGLTYRPADSPDGTPMFMYNSNYPTNQRFIEPVYKITQSYQEPMLSIIDDDGSSGFMTKLLPLIESKNIPITSAIITSYADENKTGHMSWEEIIEANNKGAEIVSHSDTHLFNASSVQEATMDYHRSFNKLRAHGVINNKNVLVFAGASASNRNSIIASKRTADCAIDSSGNKMNYRGKINPWMLARYRIDADYHYDLNSMKELIDDCKQNGGWMIWMIHCSANEWTEYNAEESLPLAIDYALSRGLRITTVNDGIKVYID